MRSFSRYQKYSLGADLRDGAQRVLKLIVRANARRERTAILLESREEHDPTMSYGFGPPPGPAQRISLQDDGAAVSAGATPSTCGSSLHALPKCSRFQRRPSSSMAR